VTRSQQRRIWIIVICLLITTAAVIYRLVSFQLMPEDELAELIRTLQEYQVITRPDRGIIYDRNMAVLATNGFDYQVGVSPSLLYDQDALATALAPILQEPRHVILDKLNSERPYELLAGRISPELAEVLLDLPFFGLQIDPLPRRIYPQNELMCHVLGYTGFDSIGMAGVEGYFQTELAGEAATTTNYISPIYTRANAAAREGADLVLTIDRTVQYVAEQHLRQAMQTHGARGGTIIVMDPRTGAILAMASDPCYWPYKFFDVEEGILLNPATSRQYEPGSVMKLVTMAAALDSGTVTPQTTYQDNGVFVYGGNTFYNWDRAAYGTVNMTQLLAHSLNIGAATIASWMGPDTFYNYLQRFGFGRQTGIDLMSEASGNLPLPGDTYWTDSDLATNSFGQGLAVTPLQMISAISALANGGNLMQPYFVQEIRNQDEVFEHKPTIISRPVSEETANQVTAMAINVVNTGAVEAQIDFYTVAGKTGTAQIPAGGIYHPTDTIGSFIGWLPADDPEMIILVKLDRPQASPWGSTTAAPTFAELAKELVGLLDIPPDSIRLQGEVMAARENAR
jgi:cell division protein FtsI/penicillin-binding protein 2